MNPGLFVLAGGGDNGGSGPGGGKGGAGNQGAGGKNGGKDASGGGKNAPGSPACGGVAGGSCSTHNPRVSRGDPVDVVTGRAFTVPELDVYLGGLFPLAWTRSYSSAARDRDIGLGAGWSHSFAWEIEVRRRSVRVFKGDGSSVDMENPKQGASVIGLEGARLTREGDGFFSLHTTDDVTRFFEPSLEDGRSRLKEIRDANENRIVLEYEGPKLQVIKSATHQIVLTHGDGRHSSGSEGRQSAPRIATLTAEAFGSHNVGASHPSAVPHNVGASHPSAVPHNVGASHPSAAPRGGQRFLAARYAYDTDGNLTSALDADGNEWIYQYSEDSLLERSVDPSGRVFSFVYDSEGRCIETWGETKGGDSSVSESVPTVLADGQTKAKGFLHCRLSYYEEGYSEVADSVQVQRFYGNASGAIEKAVSGPGVTVRELSPIGFETIRVDPLGRTTRWVRDERGRVLEEVNALEQKTVFERDQAGNVTLMITPGGAETVYQRDGRGNLLAMRDAGGATMSVNRDGRGLPLKIIGPLGEEQQFRYDDMGNVVQATLPTGATWTFVYDELGRRIQTVDPLNAVTKYSYSQKGRLCGVLHPNNGRTEYRYDGTGKLIEMIDADGRSTKVTWGGYDSVCGLHLADGSSVGYRHNREGWLTEVTNERGEKAHYNYDVVGNLTEEKTFDGRHLRATSDAASQPHIRENVPGEKTELAYDAAGRLIARAYPDDTKDVFAYDENGRLIEAENADARITFERDKVGRVIKETVEAFGETVHVWTDYDIRGLKVRRRTSLGLVEEIERDSIGSPTRIVRDGEDVCLIASDLLGREVRRTLSGGGVIESVYDNCGQLTHRRSRTRVVQTDNAGQPARLNVPETGATAEVVYGYSLAGEVTDLYEKRRGRTKVQHDPMGRLTTILPEKGDREEYGYDDRGNLFVATESEARVYGAGNRLMRKFNAEYKWGENGALIEKTVFSKGERDTQTYTWTARGLLQSVAFADGTLVEHSYDAFARRIKKRVTKKVGASVNLLSETQYVWDDDAPVHAIRRELRNGKLEIVAEQRFSFDPDSLVPLAHGDVVRNEGSAPQVTWFHYMNDRTGAPLAVVDTKGEVRCSLERDAWGKTRVLANGTTTCIRFAGQMEDAETGLCYNRYRYYDPDLGRFISPDPLGLDAGFNAYAYVPCPLRWLDPFGLVPRACAGCPNCAKPTDVIARQGESRESTGRLDKKSQEAEAAGFGHGVSTTNRGAGPVAPGEVGATKAQLEAAGMQVIHTPTKNDPNHHTVILPTPVTSTDQKKFNDTLGRPK